MHYFLQIIECVQGFHYAVMFYPHEDELDSGTIDQKLEILLESAQALQSDCAWMCQAVHRAASFYCG